MNIKNIISAFCFFALLISCENSNQTDKQEATASKEEHGHEENQENITSLTQEQMKAVGVVLGSIENKELTSTISANGVLRVPNEHKGNITSLYSGVIKNILIQVGDYVKKGQVIAVISNPQFIQLQEEYLTIGSRIIFANQELKRQQELNAGNAGALKNLQTAKTELNTLLTRKASLQKQIQLMGINPNALSNNKLQSDIVVRSPLNGTVSNISAEIGSYVDVSSPIAQIVDNSSLHLDLQLFEKDLSSIKVGQIIRFTQTNNPIKEYQAKVFSIGASFENQSKVISVHSTVIGNKEGLIDGMDVTGMISLNNTTTPAVPNDAIVNVDGKNYIFALVNKNEDEKHSHKEDEKHEHNENKEDDHKEKTNTINFERIEVVKGVSNMGYTAITLVKDIPNNTKIVVKGAFFVNAKLTNSGGHDH